MGKNIKRISSAILATACVLGAAACGDGRSLFGYTSFEYFGTETTWALYSTEDNQEDDELWQELRATMNAIENSVSAEVEGSPIDKFNRAEAGEEVELDETSYRVLELAQSLYQETDGAYNPAVGLLVDLWGFSPRFTKEEVKQEMPYDRPKYNMLPEDKYIRAFSSKEMTDFGAVELSSRDGKYYAQKPETASVAIPVTDEEGAEERTYTMQLNLGGIGKGYCVDVCADFVKDKRKEGYFSLGGSSMFVFENPDAKDGIWNIDLKNPRPRELEGVAYGSVRARDIALSTSGDNVNYYMVENVRYCHIVNPQTGYPVNAAPEEKGGIITASVFGLSAAAGDAVTTALMVMGKDKAISYINENLAGKGASFIYYDGTAYTMYTNMKESELKVSLKDLAVERF